jgi:uncharacterized protein
VIGARVRFRFHGELNDFLPADRRNVEFESVAGTTDTIKHVLESLGVPHTEFDRIIVNGQPQSSSEQLRDGAVVEVYPHVLPMALNDPRFVVDGHLGRLAAYLRMLGFDTWYKNNADDVLLAAISDQECRLLLTRDIGLLKRREVRSGYCVRNHNPRAQLREVVSRFALHTHFAPFLRCMDCNGSLYSVTKEEITDLLPPHTRETKDQFSRCAECHKVFWRGSHHARMLEWVQQLMRC